MAKSKVHDALVHFTMDGAEYSWVMPAESWADAEKRLAAIRLTGRVVGWPCYHVSMPAPLMYLAMPFLWLWTLLLNIFNPHPKGSEHDPE